MKFMKARAVIVIDGPVTACGKKINVPEEKSQSSTALCTRRNIIHKPL